MILEDFPVNLYTSSGVWVRPHHPGKHFLLGEMCPSEALIISPTSKEQSPDSPKNKTVVFYLFLPERNKLVCY